MQDLRGEKFARTLFDMLSAQEKNLNKLKIKINPRYLKYVQSRIRNIGKGLKTPSGNVKSLSHDEVLDLQFFLEQVGSINIEPDDPERDHEDGLELLFDVFCNIRVLEIFSCKPLVFMNSERIQNTLTVLRIENCACPLDNILNHFEETDGVKIYIEWPHLREIIAPGNEICFLDEFYTRLPSLERLDLTSNVVAKVQNLNKCYMLSHLILSKNCLWGVENIGTSVGNLKYLVLSHNGLFNTKGLEKLFGLEYLDISYNHISEMDNIERLAMLPCLEELLVEGNPVTGQKDFRTDVYIKFGNPDLILDGVPASKTELKLLSNEESSKVHLSKATSVSTINKKGTIEIEKQPPSGKWTILKIDHAYEYPEEAKESRGFVKAVPKIPYSKSSSTSDVRVKKKSKTKRVVKIEESNGEEKKPLETKELAKPDLTDTHSLEKIKKFHEENGSSWLIIYNAYRDREGYVDEDDKEAKLKKSRKHRQTIAHISSTPESYKDSDLSKPFASSTAISIDNSSPQDDMKDASYNSDLGSFGTRRNKHHRRTIMMSLPISSSSGSLQIPTFMESNLTDQVDIKTEKNSEPNSYSDSSIKENSPRVYEDRSESPKQVLYKCALCEYIHNEKRESCLNCNSDLIIKFDAFGEENMSYLSSDHLELENDDIIEEDPVIIKPVQEEVTKEIKEVIPEQVVLETDKPQSVDIKEIEAESDLLSQVPTIPITTNLNVEVNNTENESIEIGTQENQNETESVLNEPEEIMDELKVFEYFPDPKNISLNKKIYMGINILDGSELDKIQAYMPTNFILFNTNVSKEMPGSILLTNEFAFILSKKSPLKSYFYDDKEDNEELLIKIDYEKVKRIVVGLFYQWFRIELANESYVFLARSHYKVHRFVRLLDTIVKSRHGFINICSENEEILNNLDEIVNDSLPQSSALTFSMLNSGHAKIESYTLITHFSKLINRQYNTNVRKNAYHVIPRTLVITTNEVLLLSEDYAKWPSIMSASWVKPKTPQFTLVHRFSISDIISLATDDSEFKDENYIAIEVEKTNNVSIQGGITQSDSNYLIQIATSDLLEKKNIIKVISSLWQQLFRLELPCK